MGLVLIMESCVNQRWKGEWENESGEEEEKNPHLFEKKNTSHPKMQNHLNSIYTNEGALKLKEWSYMMYHFKTGLYANNYLTPFLVRHQVSLCVSEHLKIIFNVCKNTRH